MDEHIEDIYLGFEEKVMPSIIITSPVFMKETIGKFVLYDITGRDGLGEIDIKRRYNEFKNLRITLVNTWGGTYIPPLPRPQFIVYIT